MGQSPDVSWYDELELPEGRTYRVLKESCSFSRHS